MEQLTIRDIEIQEKQARVKAIAAELDRRFKGVALSIDRHEFAAVNDKSYSYMCEILNTNNEDGQKPFQVKFIAGEVIENPERFRAEVLDFLLDLCDCEPSEKKRRLCADEELALLKRQIREHGLEKIFDLREEKRKK